jgi:hypothetical protein
MGVSVPGLMNCDIAIPLYHWSSSVYGNPEEVLPTDAPDPMGKTIVTLHYVDANLHHNMRRRRLVTATLHFVNQAPIDWYSKKQATVKRAMYGFEF